ncbi:hypothetical protein [Pseudomonas sp. GW101-3H06]|uniref:hypothetical protein n=1 Tax=Pseudomonas sp. GW101-3H06 TaxID=2751347 RepID=UPI001A932ABC|nr:hypothetical protein [Pseudomonas sp. GW101-3H06]
MKAEHRSSSDSKDITLLMKGGTSGFKPSRPLLATAVIGTALIGYLVHKTPDARSHLENLVNMAHNMGDLSERDAAVVTELLIAADCPIPLTPK